MNIREYQIHMSERLIELLTHKDDYDRDIWNLEYMITQIEPHSLNWRHGCARSLEKAIAALKKEKEETL